MNQLFIGIINVYIYKQFLIVITRKEKRLKKFNNITIKYLTI